MNSKIENSYHRYLNLPFDFDKPAQFEEEFDTVKQLWKIDYNAPEFEKICSDLGLTIEDIGGLYTPPGATLPLHVDGGSNGTPDDFIKVNRTWGPGYATWYDPSETMILPTTEETGFATVDDAYLAVEKEEELVYKIETKDDIHLLNVGLYHGAYNPSATEGRWTLCFVLGNKYKDYITWEESLEYFKDYIIDNER